MPTTCFQAVRDREQALPRKISATAATFRADVSGSPGLIHRMELQRTLDGHGGCVNTVSFNPSGDLLVSGSDDQSVILWDWRRGVRRLRFEPGHTNNIFQARLLPGTNDKTLLSCAADGQVRVSYFREGSSRPVCKRLHRHTGRAHKLALQHVSPYDVSYGGGGGGGPPCFYSSGEDGDVCFFDLRTSDSEPLGRMAATISTGTSGRSQIIDINAVHVNPARPWQLVVGGSDEAVVVYDNRVLTALTPCYSPAGAGAAAGSGRRNTGGGGGGGGVSASRCQRLPGRPVMQLCPAHLKRREMGSGAHRPTHVTCAMFGQNGDVLATYNDDDVYLFRPPGTQGSGGGKGRPGGGGAGGDSDDDDDDASSSDDDGGAGGRGRRFFGLAGLMGSSRARRAGGSGGGRHAADGGAQHRGEEDEEEEDDSFLRPSRRRRKAGGGGSGGKRRLVSSSDGGGGGVDPADADAEDYVIGRYSGHRNNQTVKGVNFLGEREEWVVSGSDCGHIYVWARDTGRLHCWLRGDSHVVNCLEPHPSLPLHLATSGIDDDIKLWAPTAAECRPPGPAAEAAMRDNARDREAAGRVRFLGGGGGGRRLVLPRAVLRLLLGDLTRGDSDGEDGGAGGGGGGGEGGEGPQRRLRNLLMAALRPRSDDEDDEDDDEDEAEEAEEAGDAHGDGEAEDEEDEEEDEEVSFVDAEGGEWEDRREGASGSGSGDDDEDEEGPC